MPNKKKTLAALRNEKELSQKMFALQVGVSPSLVCMWETGKRNPSLHNALKIASFFGIPIEQIKFDSR